MNTTTANPFDTNAANFKKVEDINIKPADIGEKEDRGSIKTAWTLALVNLTDYCFVLARTTNSAGQWGRWFEIPKICRTCTLTYADCISQGKYSAILSTDCTDPPFQITIATQPDANGNAFGSTYSVGPDCRYGGGVIGIS